MLTSQIAIENETTIGVVDRSPQLLCLHRLRPYLRNARGAALPHLQPALGEV